MVLELQQHSLGFLADLHWLCFDSHDLGYDSVDFFGLLVVVGESYADCSVVDGSGCSETIYFDDPNSDFGIDFSEDSC